MKIQTRILCLLIAVLMVTPLLGGCSLFSSTGADPELVIPDHVYTSRELKSGMDNVYSHTYQNGRVFLRGYNNETYEEEYGILTLEDESFTPVKLELPEDAGINTITFDDQGNLYCGYQIWNYDEVTYESSTENYVMKCDEAGNTLETYDLSFLANGNEYFYPNYFIFDPAGHFLITSDQTLYVLDRDMNLEFTYNSEYWLEQPILLNGNEYFRIYDYAAEKMMLMRVDYNAKTLMPDETALADSLQSIGYNTFIGYDGSLCFSDDNGIFRINPETGDKEMICDFLNSDLALSYPDSVTALNEEQFLCSGYNYDTEQQGLFILTKKDPAEIQPKIMITIGSVGTDYNIRRAIMKFNRTSETCRVTIRDYATIGAADADWDTYITNFNNDIISGNMPDIVVMNNEMPFDSYISKGLFKDLNEYFESDETIDIADYLPNVLEAAKIGGKLYSIFPSFEIVTEAGKKDIFGDETSLSFEKLEKIRASHPDSQVYNHENFIKTEVLNNLLNAGYNYYVDKDTGVCRFDSDGFRSLLKLANEFADTYPWEDPTYYDDYVWTDENLLADGSVLLDYVWLDSFHTYSNLYNYTFEGDFTFVGAPCADGNGSYIEPMTEMCISAMSPVADQAWTFIRTLLQDEFQQSFTYFLPLKISCLEQMGKDQIAEEQEWAKWDDPVYYETMGVEEVAVDYDLARSDMVIAETVAETVAEEAENDVCMPAEVPASEDVAAVDSDFVIEEPVVMPAPSDREMRYLTQEDVDDMIDFIRSVKQIYRPDSKLMEIITEEAGYYFKGAKSLDEVVRNIQGSAQIYVDEKR